MTGNRPLLVILGPTAVGKTGLALDVAQALDGEIIGADSRQIYRDMDIGTAKPTQAQCELIPHHLVDIVNPDENLGLAHYQTLTNAAIDDVQQRGNLPLLVGGTGQYLTAVIEGWSIPEVPPNETLRSELENFAQRQGSEVLHRRLQAVDPVSASGVHHHNIRRVVRALEVFLETGTPISELQRKHPPPYNILQYGLNMDREQLYQRADLRLEQMMAQGFLEEVKRLLAMGYDRRLPSMSGLGYAQLSAYLLDGVPLEDAIQATQTITHDFIRRQLTWFRGHDSGIRWLDIEQVNTRQVINDIKTWLRQR